MSRVQEVLRTAATVAGVRALALVGGHRPPPRMPVSVMGLHFPNPLGLAAGFDRTGALVKALSNAGFGFVEVGTVTPDTRVRPIRAMHGGPVGMNIGSARPGLDGAAIDDYAAMLRARWGDADYLAANLSEIPEGEAGAAEVDRLFARLKAGQEEMTAATGRRVPLTAKINAGPDGSPLPPALAAVKDNALDGVVLVSDSPQRIAAVSAALDPTPVIAVGGVKATWDVLERLAAGAQLVQVYSAFVNGGASYPRRLLAGLGAAEAPA